MSVSCVFETPALLAYVEMAMRRLSGAPSRIRCVEIWTTHEARRFGRTIWCGDLGVPPCIRRARFGDLGVPSDVEIWVSHLVSVKRWRLGVSPQHSWGVRCAEIWATHKARRFGCAVRSNVRPMSGDLDAHKARRLGRTIRCGDLGVPPCISQALEVWA